MAVGVKDSARKTSVQSAFFCFSDGLLNAQFRQSVSYYFQIQSKSVICYRAGCFSNSCNTRRISASTSFVCCKISWFQKRSTGKAQAVEICRPRVVVCGLFCMLPAVCFDNQLRRYAHKINNIISHRLLAAEFIAVQTACPQVLPQFCFRLAHLLTHGFGALAQGGVVGGQ